MTFNRWWHAAMAAMAILLVVILAISDLGPMRLLVGLGAVTVLLVTWMLLSPRAGNGNAAAITLVIVVIAVAGVGTAVVPAFATIQFVAYPIMWTLCERLRTAIIANVVLAVAVGVGFMLTWSRNEGAVVEIVLTVVVSLAFSLTIGLWISYYAAQSDTRQKLLDELTATQHQLTAVSREAGVIAERERLARELHDTLAQDLTGLVMLAQRARRETDASARDRQLARLEESARETLTETRALVAGGSPTSLDGGLGAALTRLADRFTAEAGITVHLHSDEPTLDRDSEVVLLRCTQEALSNVRKHSGARNVTVALSARRLTISDDGHGFDPHDPSTGYGLSGMRDRLALVGGHLDVASGASGTVLTIELAATPRTEPTPVAEPTTIAEPTTVAEPVEAPTRGGQP